MFEPIKDAKKGYREHSLKTNNLLLKTLDIIKHEEY
jgi:hypothetical protein